MKLRSGLVQVWFRLKFNSLELDSEVGRLVGFIHLQLLFLFTKILLGGLVSIKEVRKVDDGLMMVPSPEKFPETFLCEVQVSKCIKSLLVFLHRRKKLLYLTLICNYPGVCNVSWIVSVQNILS